MAPTANNSGFFSRRPWIIWGVGIIVAVILLASFMSRDDSVTVAVQVNGKLRATIELPRDCDIALAESQALGDERIRRLLDGKPPRKVIVVPNRIVNVVL